MGVFILNKNRTPKTFHEHKSNNELKSQLFFSNSEVIMLTMLHLFVLKYTNNISGKDNHSLHYISYVICF